MEILAALQEILGSEGATLPLMLVGIALGLVGMALYVVILLLKKKNS